MFANEDFDLDEDFLNDISQKESQYYSQTLPSDEESPIKRFRSDEDSFQVCSSDSILPCKEPIHMKIKDDSLVQNTIETGRTKTIRTNLILERLKRNENTVTNLDIHEDTVKTDSQNSNLEKSNLTKESSSHPANNECRKSRLLEILKKNNVGSIPACRGSPKKKSLPLNLNHNITNNSELEHRRTNEKLQLKPTTTCNKPVTLVRQFPGPAGLLPHLSERAISPVISESLCFDDSNDGTKTSVIDDTSMISKYCSQNTTNAFFEGAWQLLISDLSPDFLIGHEISTIKQKVMTNSFRNNKVPFLAGIVQKVDFSCLDPLVVLKDCTGIIEGTICKNILVEYPHSLDIGAVLFLGNVGLLTIGSYLKKCHVIITLKNIINIYTGKSKIFNVTEMNARLKNLNNHDRPCESNIKQIVKVTEKTNPRLYFSNLNKSSNPDIRLNYSGKPVVAQELSGSINSHLNSDASKIVTNKCDNLLDNNHKNLNGFQAKINSLQCKDHINNPSTFDSGELQDFDDEFAASFFDIDNNPVSKSVKNINTTTNSEIQKYTAISKSETKVAVEKKSITDNAHLDTKLQKKNEDFESKASTISNEITGQSRVTNAKVALCAVAQEKSKSTGLSDIKLKLSVFRSNVELTQQPSEDLGIAATKEIYEENNKCIKSSLASDLLLDGENDSDEELFSQLDVESIVSNYNRL